MLPYCGMKNFISPHVHVQSLDSASTPDAFIKRELELQTGAITCTDHGWMGACSEVYDLAKKNNLTPILGLEGYLRDDNCPILLEAGIERDKDQTFKPYNKYYHFCVHCKNQAAYTALSTALSNAALNRAEQHGSERKPLFTWEDIDFIGQHDVTMTSGCLIGVTARHIINGERYDLAEKYYTRMRSAVKEGNYYVEIFPHKCTHYWESGVFLKAPDGMQRKFSKTKKLRISSSTKGVVELEASELAKHFKKLGEVQLIGVKHYQKWEEQEPAAVAEVEAIEGFLQNPCRPWSADGDFQKSANLFLLEMARKYGDKIIISDDAHFAYPEDKDIQDMKLTSSGGTWKFHNTYNRMSSEEAAQVLKDTLGVSDRDVEEWIDNSIQFKEQFKDFKFEDKVRLPTSRYPENTLNHLKTLISKHGRMNWDNAEMRDRLTQEINLFHKNGTIDLLPYFFLAEEVIDVYRKQRLLTGPGRGSSSGTIISYLLGITHINPLEFDLSLDRFITLDRIKSGKLPDIDMDLPNRDILMDPEKGWLVTEFGDKAAAISTKTSLRVKSSIKDVMRSRYQKVPYEIEQLVGKFPTPPQGIDDHSWVFGYTSDDGKEVKGLIEESKELQQFIKEYPAEWEIVKGALGIARGYSRHASAWVLSEVPIHTFAPVTNISGYRTTQYTMYGVEARGGLKMDFLGLACLNDIQDCINLLQKKNGGLILEDQTIDGIQVPGHFCVPIKGKLYSVYKLPDDQKVFREICEGATETVFQLNTKSAIKWLKEFNHWADEEAGKKSINSIMGIANFTALDRPGPLDAEVENAETGRKYNMLQEYARRARGKAPTGEIPIISQILPDSNGVLVTQEGLEKVYRVLTDCTGAEATAFRGYVGKKQMDKVDKAYPGFMERASKKIGPEMARATWDQIVTFGRYGFCKAHAVDYAHLAYVCAYFKHHFPLEWWTAVLKNADKKEIVEKFWKHCRHHVLQPDIQLSEAEFEIQGKKIRAPISFLQGVGPMAHAELVAGRPYNNIEDFCRRIFATKAAKAVPAIDKETGQPKIDKKTGQIKMKAGRSAINNGIVCKLIASGVMDSLFPQDATLADKITSYHEWMAKLANKKRFKVDPYWLNMDSFSRFQVGKEVLPISDNSLLDIAAKYEYLGVQESHGRYRMMLPSYEVMNSMKTYGITNWWADGLMLLEGDYLQYFNQEMELEGGQRLLVGSIGFVIADRRFKYHEGSKEAMDLTIDAGGYTFNSVRWPDRETGELTAPKDDLTGSIVLLILSRYRNDRPAVIEAVHVIKPALSKQVAEEKEEESSDGKTESPAT